jgi:hypothetical protein
MTRLQNILRHVDRTARRLHRDQRGVTSLLSLVAVMVFTMLLVMLTNVVRHVDDKVRMQNAADAAAYSGAAVLARGMNAIAFANRLEAETFALTALLRALEDRGSQSARQLLPVMQVVLGTPEFDGPVFGDRLLPEYQRDVIALVPGLAQETTHEIALRHGLPQGRLPQGASQARTARRSQFGPRGPQAGVLWLTRGVAVSAADESDPLIRTLPVVDPNSDGADWARLTDVGDRQVAAAVRRLEVATEALRALHDQLPESRRRDAGLLGDATRYLIRLLEVEYPTTNLPMMLRSQTGGTTTGDPSIRTDGHSIVATVHRAFDREHGAKLFINPLANRSDAVMFAQAEFFLPRPRYRCCPWTLETDEGVVNNTDDWPRQWDSLNQTWSVRLTPADEAAALTILQSQPPAPADTMRPTRLDGVTPLDIERVNTH